MAHYLWGSNQWENATEEDVILALFNAPRHPDPFDMGQIKRFHPNAKIKYLNLAYVGKIPESIKAINS
jgi:hypothetical protein